MTAAATDQDETTTSKWIFRGNVVVPTGNPFQALTNPPQQQDDQHCMWLGPNLKLLLDHVLKVSESGIITYLAPAAVSDVVSSASKSTNFIHLSAHEFLCPGLIDLHIHAPQFAYTGTATDRPLMGPEGWLEKYTFPAEQRLANDPDLAKRVYNGVVQTTLRHGTTTAVYFATLHLQPCQILVDCVLQNQQRALVGKVCMDRNSPENYCHSLEQNVSETKQLIDYIYQRAGRIQEQSVLPLILPLVTPRFIPTCTPALLSALGAVAVEQDCHITSHISESMDEVAFSRHLDATIDKLDGIGRTDAEIFDAHGLLTKKCIMAHGVLVSDTDLDLLQRRGTAIAHCPLSNFFFAGCCLACRKLMERGNKVGLGTDVAGGYSPSLWNSSRMAVVTSRALLQQQQQEPTGEISHVKEDPVLDYRHAFYLATLGGAHALGLDDRIGTLQVGMEFDAIVLSPGSDNNEHCGNVTVFPQDTIGDMFQKLCVLGDDRNIRNVYVQGQEVWKCA